MTPDPFVDLIVESLNLTHPRFAMAFGREYGPHDTEAAASRERERPFFGEFSHQFRHLWDRGLPRALGLGHIVLQGESIDVGLLPDLLAWQLGEHGQPHRRLGAVSIAFLSNPAAIAANGERLSRFRNLVGYPVAVNVVAGRFTDLPASGLPSHDGVTPIFFDTERWAVRQTS